MLKKQKKLKNASKTKGYTLIKEYKGIREYKLQNGLSILYKKIEGTDVVTTNITYRVGARDEERGQSGIAHMLEHMLFKQTEADKAKKVDSGAMQFERETGCILNANTWKDRTTYFFSYPSVYFIRAMEIEAQRMHGVQLTNKEFQPERNNVLSEFDMYFGDPYFALSLELVSSAYHSHPYGHETIGFRQDIERYTVEALRAFYEKFYDPHNATLMIIGDIDESFALGECVRLFGILKTNGPIVKPAAIVEPKQEGMRRVEIERPSNTNVVAFAVKHEGLPSKEWYKTSLLSSIVAGGSDSILYKKLIDKGLASRVEMAVEPSSEENIAVLYVTLTKKTNHDAIEKIVFETIESLSLKDILLQYKKVQQKIITDEIIGRSSSLSIAMEMTEYVSAEAWEKFFDTEEMLKNITAKDIVAHAHSLFMKKNMTIGRFIGKQ